MRFVANLASGKVHDCFCEFAIRSHPHNTEHFECLTDALGQGYEEAGCCLTETPSQMFYTHRALVSDIRTACLICGETRSVQLAHIVPRRMGGALTMPLCANCHWCYGSGTLTESEIETLQMEVHRLHGDVELAHGAVRG